MIQQIRMVGSLESIRRDFPYWSRVINMVHLSEEPRISTVGIDAYCRIQYNNSFIGKLKAPQLKALLIHELEHYLRGHHHRFKDLSDYIISMGSDISTYQAFYNLAADLEINSNLANLPLGMVYPEIFALESGLALEEYTGLLKDKVNIIEIGARMGRMSGDVKLPQDGIEADEARTLWEDVVNDVDEARRARAGRNSSNSKHHLQYKEKRYNWREIIKNTVYRLTSEREYGDEQSTYSSMNRRLLCVPDIIFPKFYNPKHETRILFAVDTSWSMHRELDKCFSYLMSLKKFNNEEIKISLLTADTQVNSYIENVTQLPSYAKGLGGTKMTEVFNFADEKKIQYDLLLLLTDCETGWPSPARISKYYNKTIVLSTDRGSNYDKCPFRKCIIK